MLIVYGMVYVCVPHSQFENREWHEITTICNLAIKRIHMLIPVSWMDRLDGRTDRPTDEVLRAGWEIYTQKKEREQCYLTGR